MFTNLLIYLYKYEFIIFIYNFHASILIKRFPNYYVSIYLQIEIIFWNYIIILKFIYNYKKCPRKKRIKFPWIKRFIIFPENNVPEKNVYTTFSQPLQWILCQGLLAKNLNFFFKFFLIYHQIAKKSDRILQKKLLKNLF
jgi:hypothetical protein